MVDRAVTNEALEAVILDDPRDPTGWLVYGDFLQSEGDPRGELVAVQARLARDPGNPDLMEAERALFERHRGDLLRGLDESLFAFSWEFGFLWTANVGAQEHSLDAFCDGLRALLTHPSARFLHALTVGTPPEQGWPRVLEVLAETLPPSLRMLYLGTTALNGPHPRPAFGNLGAAGALWKRLPHLEVLSLSGGVMDVGDLALPSLCELTIATTALQRETVLALGARAWPKLERLELWFGDRRCTATLAELAPLFEASRFPALTRLALRNCSFVDRICHALVTAPLARQLHVLDLSLGALTDVGAAALVDAKPNLANLAVLDLRWNYFHPEWRAQLETLAKHVDLARVLGSGEDLRRPRVWTDT